MQLKPEQLLARLQKPPLAPIYLISGDEPLQQLELCDAIRKAAREQGYSEREVFETGRGFNWDRLNEAAASLSLFAEKRIIELRMGGGPGNDGSPALIDYASRPADDTLVLISMAKIDKRGQQAKWFKAIDKVGVTSAVWPVEAARMPGWVQARCRQQGLEIAADAAELIAERVEGNLFAAAQEIEKLRLLAGDKTTIDLATVLNAVADSARYDTFEMIAAACAGDLPRALHMLAGLEAEGAEERALYGALMWQLRRICHVAEACAQGQSAEAVFRELYIFDARRLPYQQVMQRLDSDSLQQLLWHANRVDGQLKGYRSNGNPWQSLGWLLTRLAGYDPLPAAAP